MSSLNVFSRYDSSTANSVADGVGKERFQSPEFQACSHGRPRALVMIRLDPASVWRRTPLNASHRDGGRLWLPTCFRRQSLTCCAGGELDASEFRPIAPMWLVLSPAATFRFGKLLPFPVSLGRQWSIRRMFADLADYPTKLLFRLPITPDATEATFCCRKRSHG